MKSAGSWRTAAWPWLRLLLMALFLGGMLFWLHQSGVDAETVRQYGARYPYRFVFALLLLPMIGFPINPFLLAAGILYPLWKSILFITFAMAFHMSISYWLTQHLFKRRLLVWARRHPQVRLHFDEKHHVWLTFAFFFIPGIPYAMKNYLAPLTNIPFRILFGLGWPIQVGTGIIFIMAGNAVMENKPGVLIGVLLAGSLILLAGRYVSSRYTNETS